MSHVPTVLKSDRSVFDKMLPVDDNALESVAAVTDHFADAFVRENVAHVYMTLWRRNDIRLFDAGAILF